MKHRLFIFSFSLLFCHINISYCQLSYEVSIIKTDDQLDLGYVRDMVQDTNGLLWFSSKELGVLTYNGKKIQRLHQHSSKQYFPLSMAVQMDENSNLDLVFSDWDFIDGSIYKYNPYSRELVDTIIQVGGKLERLYNFEIDSSDRVWAVSDPFYEGNFVYLFRENEGVLEMKDTIPINTFVTLKQFDNFMMVTAEEAIYKYDLEGNFIKSYTLKDENKSVRPFIIDVDEKGELYAKSNHHTEHLSKAFFKYNRSLDLFEKVNTFSDDILSDCSYFRFIDDQLWFGGYGATLRMLDLSTGKVEDYSEDLKNKLPKRSHILGVFKDRSNQRWITTDKSLVKLTPILKDPYQKQLGQNFSIANLQSSYPININSIIKYDIEAEKEEFVNFSKIDKIELDHNDLWIEMDYSLPMYQKKLYYSHRLVGYDDVWSVPSKEGKLKYSRLSPGNFTLELSAGLDSTNMTLSTLSIPFVIKREWFGKWALILACGLAFGFIAYGITRYRYQLLLNQQKEIQKLRTKISSDLHDDVGSILTGVSMHSEVLSKMTEGKVQKSFTKLSSESRDAIEKMRDIVWALDSRKDKIENLVDRMKYFAFENLESAGMTCDFDLQNIEGKAFINPEKRQQIFYIFKEAITNIVKHSDGDKVNVLLAKRNKGFLLTIKDNGSLREEKVKSDGLGLSNMRMRAEKIGANFESFWRDGFQVQLIVA